MKACNNGRRGIILPLSLSLAPSLWLSLFQDVVNVSHMESRVGWLGREETRRGEEWRNGMKSLDCGKSELEVAVTRWPLPCWCWRVSLNDPYVSRRRKKEALILTPLFSPTARAHVPTSFTVSNNILLSSSSWGISLWISFLLWCTIFKELRLWTQLLRVKYALEAWNLTRADGTVTK